MRRRQLKVYHPRADLSTSYSAIRQAQSTVEKTESHISPEEYRKKQRKTHSRRCISAVRSYSVILLLKHPADRIDLLRCDNATAHLASEIVERALRRQHLSEIILKPIVMTGKDNYSLCAAVLNAARIKQTAYSGDMYRVSLAGVLKLDYTVAVKLPPIAAHGILDKAVHMLFLDGKYPAPAYDHHRHKAERTARPSVTVEIDITQHTALLAECGEV